VRQLEDFRSCIKSPAAEKDVSLVEAAYASVDELWNAVVDLVFYAFQFDTKQHEDAAAAVTAATAAAATAAAAIVADVAAEAAAKDAPAEGAEAAAATAAAATVAATPSPNPRRGKSHTQNYIDVAAGVIYAIGDNVHAIGALDMTRRDELSEFQSRIRAEELKQTALRIVAQDRY
jgi:chemotaxis protein histidine kinase CheA